MKALLLGLVSVLLLEAAQYAVVVKSGSDITSTLSKQQLKKIYLMKKHFIGEMKVIPVNLPSSSALREEFNAKVLKMNNNRLNRYWTKQHFQGVHPPLVQPSTQAVKKFVQNVQGAIGYIPKEQLDDTLEVLYEF